MIPGLLIINQAASSMLVNSSTANITISSSSRVLGMGIGLFIILFLSVLMTLLLLIASKSAMSKQINSGVTGIFALIVLVLYIAPKVTPGTVIPVSLVQDHVIVGRYFFAVFMMLVFIACMILVLRHHVFHQVFAKEVEVEEFEE